MARREFIPIPPPAPMPRTERIDPEQLLEGCRNGATDLVCVMGPTASGKTRFAVALARRFNALAGAPVAEILSADSRQVFVGMDIGTGKDMCEYGEIPVHLVDIVPAGIRYDICQYQRDFAAAYADCRARGVIPILCGGSGLYVEAVTKPEYRNMPDNDLKEGDLPEHTFYIATCVDRETRRAKIDRRLDERLREGMVDEIKGLLEKGVPSDMLLHYGLEYRHVTRYLLGETDYDTMREELKNAIHQFAKRQMTWLRGMEKDGVSIHWTEPDAI